MNKYLEKIAEKEGFDPSSPRAVGRGVLEGIAGRFIGGVAGNVAGAGAVVDITRPVGMLLGLSHGVDKSLKNQRKEYDASHEKAASNAISRRLNDPHANMTVGGTTSSRAWQGGNVPASTATKAFSHGGQDVLATTDIHQRLAARRTQLGLPAANGDRVKQIANANAIHAAGAGGNITKSVHSPTVAANASNLNTAMRDAKAGAQTHFELNKALKGGAPTSMAHSSLAAQKAAPAAGGLLSKARGLVGKLPVGKIMVGAGAAAAGVGALALRNRAKRQQEYGY